MKRVRLAVTGALFVAFVVLTTACVAGGNHEADGAGGEVGNARKATRTLGGRGLIAVMKETADAGKGFSLKDATNLGRYIYHGQADRYLACFEEEVPKMQAVDIYAVPATEKCPDRLGAEVPVPKAPDLSGGRVEESLLAALLTGYHPSRVKVFKANDSATPVPPEPLANWRVCTQRPRAGMKFDASAPMKLYVAKECR